MRAACPTLLLAAALTTGPRPAAGAPEPLRPGLADALVVAGLLAADLALEFGAPEDESPNWTAHNGLDDGVRDGLRGASREGRERARQASNVTLPLALALPPLLVLGAEDQRVTRAVGVVALEAEAVLAATLLTQVTKRLVARARPWTRDESRPDRHDPYRSFFSGHSSTTFAAAGATCALQSRGHLVDGGTPWICSGAFATAATTGLLRIVADEHYATDVLTGAAAGTACGLFGTWLRLGDPKGEGPTVSAQGPLMMVSGVF